MPLYRGIFKNMTNYNKNFKRKKIEKLHNLANIGRLSAGIIHDLINPLNAVMLNLDQALSINFKNKQLRKHLSQADLASFNMKNILISAKDQVNFNDKLDFFKISSEIKKAIKIIDYKLKKENINLKLEVCNKLEIYGSKTKFNRVLSNLIINAIDACESTNKRNKEIKIKSIKQKKKIIIQIIDNGCGIPESLKKQLFKPFFSRKNGIGLGLCLANTIIKEDFSGSIKTITNNKNTIFQIEINC